MENSFYEMITATVSHDMRTPINAIMGITESLDQFVSLGNGKKLLQVVSNSSKILLFLVNDILDFFQLKNGQFHVKYDKVDIKKPVSELIDMFKVVTDEKNLQMISETETDTNQSYQQFIEIYSLRIYTNIDKI
ncbi:multi-sensor hybrid histidine kinase [Stylonychia lemnae]|uniref:Multi-sensor hybrid histidine kinase n=1 Tax=Stylonychia lemnae TaxID=5949 RepID=A0A078A5T5_STYLE|nr:multi-sensor hybrid histidine kinase [Stylonychia lemnae]|eukprot:CDW76910.1 multi-sensor hybrid histidine kinase [Stylonychia lemnae]